MLQNTSIENRATSIERRATSDETRLQIIFFDFSVECSLADAEDLRFGGTCLHRLTLILEWIMEMPACLPAERSIYSMKAVRNR